ncbi:MAG: hypothetical protein Ct9H300mP28_06430 [Pseudomonadota bacterium]|nr:MAG: hypothetical protein Ct9H300mP28_06430 [Pseudomonadota bacterium]
MWIRAFCGAQLILYLKQRPDIFDRLEKQYAGRLSPKKTLENEVIKRYMLQLQIYTLATSYWFKLETKEKFENRFGGVLYIFFGECLRKKECFFFPPKIGMICLIMKKDSAWKFTE